ncbi:membrane protein [Weissella uvarum]|uniref:YihY/virulence factor BrkB family protein n=1 Tax=Weissella uvarum TaxID=1479233 RepID=UPI0019604DE3|nr:YihY/virulence factor BrkB family protein [Weissella uvarum]MBM7618044.1 membrane protein [Weissella uvarum]MCM0595099.1 YihY/virulence factor BrkB family protein [Weissella uvarum]
MRQRFKQFMQKPAVQTILDYCTRIYLGYSSAAITYYALLAIFPSLIVIGNLLSILNLNLNGVMHFLNRSMPASATSILQPIIKSILTQHDIGTLSISLVVMLWTMSRLVASIRISQNTIYGVHPKNVAIIDQFISFFWLIIILGIISAILLFAAFGSNILEALPVKHQLVSQINVFKPYVVWISLFIGVSLFNWLLPVKKPWLPWALVGTFLEVSAFTLLTQFFSNYVSVIAKAYSFYKAMGSVIVAMLWINFMALISIICTIITAILNEFWPGSSLNRRDRLYSKIKS